MITQAELKELLHYNPETGVFKWKKKTANCIEIGDMAGCLNSRGYLIICINSKNYYAHRLAWLYMTGEWPVQIDHINHIKDDNSWINLRETTSQENSKNRSLRKTNKSGVIGVGWCKQSNKWKTGIKISQKAIHLGYFTDKFEAICARKSAERKYEFHPNHGATNE